MKGQDVVHHYRWLLLALAAVLAVPALAATPGPSLSTDDLRVLLPGKTQREVATDRPLYRGEKSAVTEIFLRPDNTAYLSSNGGRTIWRGKWDIEGDKLCLPGAYWPCAEFHRTGEQLYKRYGAGAHGLRQVELVDGDPDGVAARIDASYPYNGAKPIQ